MIIFPTYNCFYRICWTDILAKVQVKSFICITVLQPGLQVRCHHSDGGLSTSSYSQDSSVRATVRTTSLTLLKGTFFMKLSLSSDRECTCLKVYECMSSRISVCTSMCVCHLCQCVQLYSIWALWCGPQTACSSDKKGQNSSIGLLPLDARLQHVSLVTEEFGQQPDPAVSPTASKPT